MTNTSKLILLYKQIDTSRQRLNDLFADIAGNNKLTSLLAQQRARNATVQFEKTALFYRKVSAKLRFYPYEVRKKAFEEYQSKQKTQ
jgi:hypothetical protein